MFTPIVGESYEFRYLDPETINHGYGFNENMFENESERNLNITETIQDITNQIE